MKYASHFNNKQTVQTQPIPGREAEMVVNSAGGYTFQLDRLGRLLRFLVLGNEGGTYYATEKTLTIQNAQNVVECAKHEGVSVVDLIVDVSLNGRAPKNDPAIFALAICASSGTDEVKKAAFAAIPKVCRTGTHLFQFVEAVNGLRGWGRGLKSAVANWYTSRSPEAMARQVTKYQQRNGWSHRDVLRLSHPILRGPANDIAHWVCKGWEGVGEEPHPNKALLPIWAFEKAKKATTENEIIGLIRDYGLVREHVPTNFLNSKDVWAALLEEMPITAMIRNLGKMSSIGLLTSLSSASKKVCETVRNVEVLKDGRVHPLALLVALNTYQRGRGVKGDLSWTPVQNVVSALNDAFYLAFKAVTPTNKRWMLALDVSASMNGGEIAGMPGITPRIGSAAMALVTANVESQHMFTGFTSGGGSSGIAELKIRPGQQLDEVVRYMDGLPFGGTDCSLPMLYAKQRKLEVDAFVVYTDNESYVGSIHPSQALKQYRQDTGIDAKLIVVAMTSTGFSIADPDDSGMLDIVGFDTAAPDLMSQFVSGL